MLPDKDPPLPNNRPGIRNFRLPQSSPPAIQRRIYHWSASSSHRLNNWESSPAPVLSDPPEIHNRRRFYAETQPRPITQGVSSGLIWNPAPIPRMEYESFDDECPSTSTSVKLNSLPSLVSSTFYNNDSNGTQNQQSALDSYCFYDQGHPMGLISQLAELRSDNTMCDVELVVDGCSIMAHKCVLAAAIPYFRIMFTGAMIESRKNRITINDIEYEALKALVDFVYTSSIRINSENVQNILFAASILQMDNVCGACQQFLSRFLTTNNCLSIRQFAEIHNCTDLLGSTEAFAIDHFSELRKNDEFLHIPFNHLESLIKREDLLIKKENEVFDAIVSWVDCKPDERKKHFFDLISHLRWSQMSIRFLKTIVKQNNYINEDFRCKELVSEAALEMLTSQDLLVPLPQKVINQENGDQYAASSSTNEPINISKPFHNRIAPRKSLAGVIFCAGGRGTVGVPFRTVEAYDWRKNSWIAVPEMIQQRRHVGVVSAQGKLYAIGGHDGHVHLDSAEVFDPEIGVWRSIAPMHTSRRGIAVTGLDGAIYAVGGLDDHTCFPTVERYDIELDQWTEVAHMCSHRGGVGVTAFRNYLFAIGGNDGTHSLNSCERYDPLLNKWKMIKSMCNRRAGAGVSVLNGFLYAVGGFDDNAPLATCERYNVITDTWESLDNMSCPRGGVGVASMGGLLYAIGGHDGVKYLNTVECYDPYLNRWSPVADIKECRAGAGVAWADVRIDDIQPRQMDSVCGPFGAGQCI